MKKRSSAIKAGLMCFALILFILLSLYATVKLPQALPANADEADFSAERGLEHTKAMSVSPHPVGAPATDAVMNYIVDTLNSLGIETEIQKTTTNRGRDFVSCKNVIAQIEGTEGRNTVLLDAHYDSTDSSPAATDDSIGVSALLETARALKAGEPIKNNIVFLFTNPEERGMHGAIAFLRERNLAKEVDLALCLDAGGFSGPNFIKLTSRGNDWMIREFSKITPGFIGNGAIQAFGNDASDFIPFEAFGSNALGYGITTDRRIHTPNDNLEHFKPAALQQMGDFTLSFARHFGNYGFDTVNANEAAFFNFPPFGTISYSIVWAIPVMLVSVILFALAIWLGFRKKMLTFKGIGLGAIVQLPVTLIVPVMVYFAWSVLSKANNLGNNTAMGHAYNEGLFSVIFISSAVLVITLGHVLLKKYKKGTSLDYTIGCLVVPFIGLIALSIIKPMASYILAIPMLFACVMIIWWLYSGKTDVFALKPAQLVSLFIIALVAIFLFIPPIYIGFIGLETNMAFLPAVFIGMLAAFLAPHFNMIVGQFRRYVPLASFAALAVSVILVFTFSYSREYPIHSSLFYVENADTGKAYWGGGFQNGSPYLDKWTAEFFPGEKERKPLQEAVPYFPFDYKYYLTPAPTEGFAPPTVEVLDVKEKGEFKEYHISVRSPRNAALLELFVRKDCAEITSFSVNGINYATDIEDGYPPELLFRFSGLPSEGINVVITAKKDKPLKLLAVDHTFGLPLYNVPGAEPIPQNTIISYHPSIFAGYSTVAKAVEMD